MKHLKSFIFIFVLTIILLLSVGAVLRREVFFDLLPFQEKVISTKITPDGKYELNSVCKQNILSVNVYLDLENLQRKRNSDPVRFFVAERDVVQDCDSFVIQTLEQSTQDRSLTVNFLENRKTSIEIQ